MTILKLYNESDRKNPIAEYVAKEKIEMINMKDGDSYIHIIVKDKEESTDVTDKTGM